MATTTRRGTRSLPTTRQRLNRVVQVRFSDEIYDALVLESSELGCSQSETARSLITIGLHQRHPDLLGHLVDDELPTPDGSSA